MSTIEWVQIICAATIPIAVIGVLWNRAATEKGIGVRAIQFLAAATLSPAVVILATAGKIDGATTAAIIGTLVGYLFSSIAKFDDR